MIGEYTAPDESKEKVTHYAFSTGTGYTPFRDLLTESFVFGKDSGRQMIRDFLGNILQDPLNLSDTGLMLLLQESDDIIEKQYQVSKKIEVFHSLDIQKDARIQEIVEQASQYAQTPKEMLQKLYAKFQFTKLYKEYM